MVQFRSVVLSATLLAMGFAASSAIASENGNCRYTQGYWQNRAQNAGGTSTEVWTRLANRPFYLSGLTYAATLQVPPRGNAYWILGRQLVAADANVLNGGDTVDAARALARARELMSAMTPAQVQALPKNHATVAELIIVAKVLDDWNNGRIGASACGGDGGDGGN